MLLGRIRDDISKLRTQFLEAESQGEFDQLYARITALLRVQRVVMREIDAVAMGDTGQHDTALLAAQERKELLEFYVNCGELETAVNIAKSALYKATLDVHALTEQYIIWALQNPVELPEWAVEILTSEQLV